MSELDLLVVVDGKDGAGLPRDDGGKVYRVVVKLDGLFYVGDTEYITEMQARRVRDDLFERLSLDTD